MSVQIAIVGSGGLVGGIAERAIKTGSMDKATENPVEMVKDFATNATGHGINKVAEAVITKAAGGAVATLSGQLARAQTASRQAKVAERLENATAALENKQRAASAATETAREAVVRQQNQKHCTGTAGCQQ